MSSSVDRTFVINFRVVPTKVKYPDISDFISTKLGFDLAHIKHLQVSNGRVFVGTDSPQLAQDMVQEHNLKHQIEHEGKQYAIPLSMEDGSVEVRIHDLRPRITNKQVAQRMQEYGEIISIREEIWKDFFPGVPNGVRVLRMKLRKPIPSYVTVDSDMSLVTYKGQAATCKHCQRNVHYTQTCSEYAKSLSVSVNDRMTMAEALKGIKASTSIQHTDGNISPRQSTSNTTNLMETVHTHSSKVSLADEISISSDEHMEQEYPQLHGAVFDAVIDESSNAMETATEEVKHGQASSDGMSGSQLQTVNSQHSTQNKPNTSMVNVKRQGSPIPEDDKNAEKRKSRQEVRSTQPLARVHSKGKNRNH